MRVLIATDTPVTSHAGSAHFCRVLAAGLSDYGHEVDLVAPGAGRHSETADVLSAVCTHAVPPLSRPGSVRTSLEHMQVKRAVRHLVERRSPAVMHVMTPFGVGAVAARVAETMQVPLVVSAHGLSGMGKPMGMDRATSQRTISHAARTTQRAQVVTVPHDELRAALSACGGGSVFRVIPAGVDVSQLGHTAHTVSLRAQWSREHSARPMTIAAVGRLVPCKRFDDLLRAVAALAQHRDVRLDIVGDGPARGSLEVLAWELGISHCVRWWGEVDSRSEQRVLAHATVCVVPGEQESLGVAALQAMALRVPVVVADSPASREIVRHEETGLVFHGGDIHGLTRALERVFTADRTVEAVTAAAQRRVSERTVTAVVRQCLHAYTEAMACRSLAEPLDPEFEKVRSTVAALAPLVAS